MASVNASQSKNEILVPQSSLFITFSPDRRIVYPPGACRNIVILDGFDIFSTVQNLVQCFISLGLIGQGLAITVIERYKKKKYRYYQNEKKLNFFISHHSFHLLLFSFNLSNPLALQCQNVDLPTLLNRRLPCLNREQRQGVPLIFA